MNHYRSNLRDIRFNLFEVLNLSERLGSEPFELLSTDDAHSVLDEVERLASGELAASFTLADRHPPLFDPIEHSAVIPEALKSSYRRLIEGEWHRLDLPRQLGGYGAPPTLRWAVAELLLGANPAAFMYAGGAQFASILYSLGTPEQQFIAEQMVEQGWAATMVLTEPDAGSDVGAGRTTATAQLDGTWHISGVKRFITSGEHDLTSNIVHFVLARPQGAGPGTKGLSMFIVPKFLIGPKGELGTRNGVYATNLEHKMGLKASTTCELTFGEREPAIGSLVGNTHDGIAQMFTIIEYARMLVGSKAIATLSSGYLNALEYAKQRVQGPDLASLGKVDAPRVSIIHHPDVRRSLLRQKCYAEGLRALVLYTAHIQDRIAIAEHTEDLKSFTTLRRRNDLLLPIVKGCGSERSYELLGSECLQTFGGSGFLQDYPIEQYVRDAKIDTLYEGTTAIQGQDLFFRKILRDRGAALSELVEEIQRWLRESSISGSLAPTRTALETGIDEVVGMVNQMSIWAKDSSNDPPQIYRAGLNTTRLLLSLGDLLIGWLLLRHAVVAQAAAARGGSKDAHFYQGKVAAAQYFAQTVLPELSARATTVAVTTDGAMELNEAAF
ncbi:MAG: acyl-CoA dehydrogenase [Acidimicrobiales bacterium]|nr:MAG: acyl-CoA dehydrogenase [Acidimicrobiales bacterium]